MLFRRGLCKACDAGTAGIEFAIVAPILVVIAFAAVNQGMMVTVDSSLAAAARVGAEYVRTVNPNCASKPVCVSALRNIVRNYTVFPSTPTVSLTNVCTCTDSNSPYAVDAAHPCPPAGGAGTSPCSTVTTDPRVFVYQVVTVSIPNYSPIFAFGYFGPSTLSATSSVRSQ